MHIKISEGYECHLPWSLQPTHSQQSQGLYWSSSQSKQEFTSTNKHTIQNKTGIDMYACMSAKFNFTQVNYVKMWYLISPGVYNVGVGFWFYLFHLEINFSTYYNSIMLKH